MAPPKIKPPTDSRSSYVVAAENLGAALVALDEATQTFAAAESAYIAARDALDAAQSTAIDANNEVQSLMSRLQPRTGFAVSPTTALADALDSTPDTDLSSKQKPAHVLEREAHERRKAEPKMPEAPLASTTVAGPHPALAPESHEFNNWESAEPQAADLDTDGVVVPSVPAEPDIDFDEPDLTSKDIENNPEPTAVPVDNDW